MEDSMIETYPHRHLILILVIVSTSFFFCGRVSSESALTFLTSRSNGMVSVYDVSRTVEGLVHLDALPYVISGNVDIYQRNVDQRFIFRDSHMALVRHSEDQGLQILELLPSNSVTDDTHSIKLSQDMQELLERKTNPGANLGPAALQEYAQVDLHLTYDGMFFATSSAFSPIMIWTHSPIQTTLRRVKNQRRRGNRVAISIG